MHNTGDVVTYTEGGKPYKAFVFGSNSNIASHLGKQGEPMLHLAVFDEDPKHLTLRMTPRVPIRLEYDVVHESQEFTEAYYKEHGKETAAQHKGNGVWSWRPTPKPGHYVAVPPQPAPSGSPVKAAKKPEYEFKAGKWQKK